MKLAPLALVALSIPGFAQTTWFVDGQGTPPGTGTSADPYTSIAFALAQPTTVDGDTLQVAPGTYVETVDFLGKAVRVIGIGTPTIDAGGAGSAVSFVNRETRASVLENFVVTSGVAAEGGGVHAFRAAPTLRKCTITGNAADEGGGLWSFRGDPLLEDCVVDGNTAIDLAGNGVGGAAAVCGGRVEIVGGQLNSNLAEDGAGLHLTDGARALLVGATLENNEASDGVLSAHGGGAYVDVGSRLTLTGDCVFRGNRAQNDGGGVFVQGVLECEETLFDSNRAGFNPFDECGGGSGGGVLADIGSEVSFFDTTFLSNEGCLEGGAVAFNGAGAAPTVIEECFFSGNWAQFGGALFVSAFGSGGAVVTVDHSEFVANDAFSVSGSFDAGGAVFGPGTLFDCLIQGNTATGLGGGANDATLVRCDVIDNIVFDAVPDLGLGGGLYDGTAIGCRFIGNRTSTQTPGLGGAAFASGLIDCVLLRNEADFGGGAANSTLTSCTLLDNVALAEGGGAFDANLTNSIVWGSSPDQVGGMSGVNWCNVEGGLAGTGNFANDPLLWDPTVDDVHLAPGSPCIDAGDPAGPPDLDGSRGDVGALDFDPTYCPGPTNYCEAKVSAAGCVPSVSTAGTASASGPDDFHLLANDVPPGRPGLFLVGRERANAPLLGGRRCVGQFFRRPFVMSTGSGTCGGVFDEFLSQATLANLGFVPGDCLSAQLWYRDPQQPDGTGIGLSNGVSFPVVP